MENVNQVLIGWLLGLGSVIITDFIRESRRKILFIRAVRTEIIDVRVRFLAIISSYFLDSADFKHSDIKWLLPRLKGGNPLLGTQEQLEILEKLLESSESEIASYLLQRNKFRSGKSATYQPQKLFSLEKGAETLGYIEPDKLSNVFFLLNRIDEFNLLTVDHKKEHYRTFEQLSEQNRTATMQNLRGYEMNLARTARSIVDAIDVLLSKLN